MQLFVASSSAAPSVLHKTHLGKLVIEFHLFLHAANLFLIERYNYANAGH